ncbi:Ger(x)C family spore germination protein [Lysinibacillus sp. SGAir0095]|uniref:Ger(x)C family spore germination protein n=1 Tax=Lysinibacillus sp. SGAir0095 TaxID=2070463 RepID=UPI0010CCE943|nr:Ger(x)C family spore germination protein [Lysinibacillus sp. SGAir0095]QCR32395.1 Ger(x)C family spore germination protein [Lysinibacillus sp. SGAir0095]
MKHFTLILLIILSTFFLSSCSGLKNIQDITYIVAIGMDYNQEKDEYTVYLQALNFSNVAKQESTRPTDKVPVFVGKATGESLNIAVSKLYSKTEPYLFFGHVNALVLSQEIVTHRNIEVVEEIGRNRSLRSTIQVVSTKDNIEDIFRVEALFNYPTLYTILFKNYASEVARDEIRPITLMEFLKSYYEPMGVAKMPSVKIDDTHWTSDGKYPSLYFDGYEIFQNRKHMSHLPFHDAIFLNWLLDNRVVLNRKIEKGDELLATVEFLNPKLKFHYTKGTEYPEFTIDLSVNVNLLEELAEVKIEELTKLIEDDIKEDIQGLYQKGIEHKMDILNVGENWYRKKPGKYRELKNSYAFYLDENSLQHVNVSVNIFHFNSYKYDAEKSEELE